MAAKKEFTCTATKSASTEFLRNVPLFANLRDSDVKLFSDVAQLKTYKKGQYLYIEGDAAQYFYIICNGWLKLLHLTEEGEEIILNMLNKNNVTGENSLFEQGNFACTAQIVEKAQILSIPINVLKYQMSLNTQLAINMLTSMIQYQRKHEMRIEHFMLYSAPQRVGCFILGLCPENEQKDGVKIKLPYDKTLIANTLGMKGPTFSRALNMLRDETGTTITGSHVKITSINSLLRFVDGCYIPHYNLCK
jgi:CRP-like cAMP-binding protein